VDLRDAGRLLLAIGLGVAVLGALLVGAAALGLGRLPGDLAWRRGNVRLYAPIATCLLLSVVITVVVNLLRR